LLAGTGLISAMHSVSFSVFASAPVVVQIFCDIGQMGEIAEGLDAGPDVPICRSFVVAL